MRSPYELFKRGGPRVLRRAVARCSIAGRNRPSEEAPGLSTFIKDGGTVFHTYSTYGRGLDIIIGAYNMLDLAPKGRDEDALPWSMAWVRRHDEYGKDQG